MSRLPKCQSAEVAGHSKQFRPSGRISGELQDRGQRFWNIRSGSDFFALHDLSLDVVHLPNDKRVVHIPVSVKPGKGGKGLTSKRLSKHNMR